MIRVAIAEDNVFLSKSLVDNLSTLDDVKLKHVSSNGEKLLEQLQIDSQVDVILMDIEMPKMDGIATTAEVSRLYPQIKIIMLTVFEDDESLFNAIQAGANGYMLKDESLQKIHAGMKDVLDGGAPMTGSIAMRTLKLLRSQETAPSKVKEYDLTKREKEILEHLCQGQTYTEIAENLIISPKTVRKHIENVYQKLEVHSKLDAVTVARNNRLV